MALSPKSDNAPLTRQLLSVGRHYLSDRRVVVLVAAAAIAVGLAFNWTWLVAAGIAPILLSMLPCAAMCALGICMMHRAKPQPYSLPRIDNQAASAGSVAGRAAACCAQPADAHAAMASQATGAARRPGTEPSRAR
jgi:hypothetical protein